MRTYDLTSFVPSAVLAAVLFALGAMDARAWSFNSCGSFGGWGSYGNYGSYGGYARYGRYVGYGSSGSYGSYGSYGNYGGVSYGSYGSRADRTFYSAYSAPTNFVPEPPPLPAPDSAAQSQQATIHLSVPPDAQVFVNDQSTDSTGTLRRYASRGLRSGQSYVYRLRVEFKGSDGQIVENKRVRVKAGDAIELEFGGAEQLADKGAATTELTLHVPKNAEVTLGGAATAQTGEIRTYATSALAAGQTWDNYVVRVEVEEDGQTLVKEQALTLVGGKEYELTFDFADEPTRLAALD